MFSHLLFHKESSWIFCYKTFADLFDVRPHSAHAEGSDGVEPAAASCRL